MINLFILKINLFILNNYFDFIKKYNKYIFFYRNYIKLNCLCLLFNNIKRISIVVA